MDVKCEKKKEAKDDPRVLIYAIKKTEPPVTELRKTAGRAAVWSDLVTPGDM